MASNFTTGTLGLTQYRIEGVHIVTCGFVHCPCFPLVRTLQEGVQTYTYVGSRYVESVS